MMGGMGVGTVGPMGSGYQLVRDPTSGTLLLLAAAPDLSHTVLWGGVGYHPPAPLLLPPPPAAPPHLQLLPGDLLASTATLQHTHTHSTRLVTLQHHPGHSPLPAHHVPDKRKPLMQPLITPHHLVKLEPEKPPEPPPHVYYAPASPPAAPPTPPVILPPIVHPAHRDASNQTDHVDDDDGSPNHADDDEHDVACVGVAHSPGSDRPPGLIDSNEESSDEAAVGGAVEKAIDAIERDEDLTDNSNSGGSHDLVIDTSEPAPLSRLAVPPLRGPVDVSGLELLSNSIEQFERTTPGMNMPALDPTPLSIDTRADVRMNINIKTSPKSPPRTELDANRRFQFPPTAVTGTDEPKPLRGLGLLCALVEQMEEVKDTTPPTITRPFIKTEPSSLLNPTERHRRSSETSSRDRKDKHRHRDGDSSSERRHKRVSEERLRHKIEKMRRHKRERERDETKNNGGELEASIRRVTACACGLAMCTHTSSMRSAEALVNAIEKDMRHRLQELERQCDEKRAQLSALTPPIPTISTPPTPSTPVPSPDSDRGSSQKRKVGRPRKVSSPDSTETIVAKKPKSKSSLVGYLLAKGRLKGGILCSRGEPSREEARTSKVRPKLKAEPIVKAYSEEEEGDWGLNRSTSSSMESLNEIRLKNREKTDRLARKHSRDDLPEFEFAMRRGSASSESDDKERRRAKKRRKSVKSQHRSATDTKSKENETRKQKFRCTLKEEHLVKGDTDLRVLTAMGGLFYAGKLSAVQAPDVYAITLDGERGNKPHIMSREETLRDAVSIFSCSFV